MRKRTDCIVNAQVSILDEIIVDNFAGGGGASTGIELATGRVVDIAINHDPDAILMHKTNHPHTEHYQASVWDVDPVKVCRGRPVGLSWFSPDCKHFSKAKGAAPVDRNIRGLAWIVLRWAGTVRPRIIILENVEEFVTWGPVRKGKPVKRLAGQTFLKWKSQLEALGYDVDHRELVAADYGAPTTRKRFVLVARCDGHPVVWPERTHAPADSEEARSGHYKPWCSAAEIIDWSIPMFSVFDSKDEIKNRHGVNAVRPLADNTMRRVIRGVDKFTIKSGKPFLVECNHTSTAIRYDAFRGGDVDAPMMTITARHGRGVCDPLLAPVTFSNTSGSVGSPANAPVHTVTTDGKQVVASAQLTAIGQTGGGDRVRDIREPVQTVVSKQEVCVTSAQLIQYHTEQTENVRASGLFGPMQTIDGSNRYGLVAANMTEYYGNGNPLNLREPMHTVTGHDREALAAAHICKYFGGVVGAEASEPLPTVTSVDHNAVAASHIVEFKGQDIGQRAGAPLRTITTSAGEFALCHAVIQKYDEAEDVGRWPQIRALLNRHCGYDLKDDEIVLLVIGGTAYYIRDILLRMLQPRELYAAMGFPLDYIIDRDYKGNEYGKTKQVARCGNAVCPPMAEAVVRANYVAAPVYITTMAQLAGMVGA